MGKNKVTIPEPGDSADTNDAWSVPGAPRTKDHYQRASGAFRQSLKEIAKKTRKGGRD